MPPEQQATSWNSQRLSTTEHVHIRLRDAITSGELPPGSRLRETDLANKFGFSPTPIREALRILVTEGLVQYVAYKGHTVPSLSPVQIDHLYDIHQVLECRAVELAASHGQVNASLLADIMSRTESTLNDAHQLAFNRCDLQFHEAINSSANNPELVHLIMQIHRRLQSARIALLAEDPDRPRRSFQQHRNILDAVLRRDVDAAIALTKKHIFANRQDVHTRLERAASNAEKE